MSSTEAAAAPAPEVKKSPPPPKEEPKIPEAKSSAKSPPPKTEAPAADAPKQPTFQERFRTFSKFGDTKSDGKHLTLSQSDKWMKQAGVIDGKKITTTDTGIYFKKFKQQKIGYANYGKFLEELAKVKKVEVIEMKTKMRSCGEPGLRGTTTVVKNSTVERLSDSPKKKEENSKTKPSPRTVKSPIQA